MRGNGFRSTFLFSFSKRLYRRRSLSLSSIHSGYAAGEIFVVKALDIAVTDHGVVDHNVRVEGT